MKRKPGYSWVIAILSSGWGEGNSPFHKMRDPHGTINCLLAYLRVGDFTDKQKIDFLPELDKWYQWWCRQKKIQPEPMPPSLKKKGV